MEPQKRRRFKVVRACRECRRKKTKCDGEKICSACIKSQTDCQYITSKKVSSDHTLETIGTTTVLTSTRQHHHQQQEFSSSSSTTSSSVKNTTSRKQSVSIAVTIHSIEKRLTNIEDQLKYIFQKQHLFFLPPPPSSSLPPLELSSSLSPLSSSSSPSISSKNDPFISNDSSSSFYQDDQVKQQEKNMSSLLTLPPLQSLSTTPLYNEANNLFRKKIPLLESILHDK